MVLPAPNCAAPKRNPGPERNVAIDSRRDKDCCRRRVDRAPPSPDGPICNSGFEPFNVPIWPSTKLVTGHYPNLVPYDTRPHKAENIPKLGIANHFMRSQSAAVPLPSWHTLRTIRAGSALDILACRERLDDCPPGNPRTARGLSNP